MRLQRKLQMEVERREALCRHLSESESSLEMEEERLYNESLLNNSVNSLNSSSRQRTISSPVPHSPSSSSAGSGRNGRPISPSGSSGGFPGRCSSCGQLIGRRSSGFIKPAIPMGVGGGGGPTNAVGGGGGGGFSPNHSMGSGGSSAAGLMHTFLQPASPMDTSVYKE